MQVLLLVNRKAGASHAAELIAEAVRLLDRAGFPTTPVGELEELAERSHALHAQGQLRGVVAAGGDGTITAALNRIPHGLPLAVLPLGTENLLARYFHIRRDPAQLVETIVAGHGLDLDMGSANGRLFALMASAGFDAEVVRRVHARRTGNIRHWSYVQPILAAMRNYEYPELRVYCGDSTTGSAAVDSWRARWCFAFNLPCYARGLPIAPSADGTDGRFDVCTLARGSTSRGLWYLANVMLRRHERLADCRTQRAARVRLESDGEVPYQLDGDAAGYLPLELEIIPARMRLLVPPSTRPNAVL
ncbi:MAG: hypothetical protein KF708_15665 [Pirellulales bacterium]|nr:hypothetical protein [Pirellulales bacterium]